MNITVTFRHLPSSEALKAHAEEKVEKFSKYLFEPIDIHIILTVEKIRQIAEVNLTAKDFRANALEESEDMYTSIDLVMTKIETQVRKHKEKISNHKIDSKSFEALEAANEE